MKTLPPELRAFFDTHKASTREQKSEIDQQLIAVQRISTSVKRLLVDVEGDLQEAELTAPAEMRNKFNFMHTRARSVTDKARAFFDAARELSGALGEFTEGLEMDDAQLVQFLDIIVPDDLTP